MTTFVWEGLRLLAENRDGLPLVYVYEDTESYTPLARVWGSGEKARVDYYRCSQNGMPEALTDEQGKQHWRLEVDTQGEKRVANTQTKEAVTGTRSRTVHRKRTCGLPGNIWTGKRAFTTIHSGIMRLIWAGF